MNLSWCNVWREIRPNNSDEMGDSLPISVNKIELYIAECLT